MEIRPRGQETVTWLLEQGARISSPSTVHIGPEVDPARISCRGVTIYPGCRIYGAKTVISQGVTLGSEGPVTIDDCRLGPGVELKGGYFKGSVFLEKANMGLGAHVREACLLEEQANGAHCVGLKQTILFPFVTLGSLINFCDCLMAGGTSRKDHSEVGSSYIHFNYTPDGDKTTASLFGDVPRGVMLDQPPIFLGGQGGAVGPVRVSFGTVVAAGSILRHDVLEEGRLVAVAPPPGFVRDRPPHSYGNVGRLVRNNLLYLANLVALEEWYKKVRQPFFAAQELGALMYEGALEMLTLAKEERCRRLITMAEKVPATNRVGGALREEMGFTCRLFGHPPAMESGERFVSAFWSVTAEPVDYISAIKALPADVKAAGVRWLQEIVDTLMQRASETLPALEPPGERR